MADEVKSRASLFATAKKLGIEVEIRRIVDRTDNLLKVTSDPTERKQIKILGLVELHKAMNCAGPLVVGGQEILPGDPTYVEPGKITKLD